MSPTDGRTHRQTNRQTDKVNPVLDSLLWNFNSNFICILFVAMGRSLLVFSDVTFKMAAWRPSWIFLFPDSNFTLALNIKSKLQWHITRVYGKEPIDFQQCHFQNVRLVAILDFAVSGLLTSVLLWISNANFSSTLPVCMPNDFEGCSIAIHALPTDTHCRLAGVS